jgi:DNA ligase (NAD+)
MLSLTDIFELEELEDWQERWEKLVDKDSQTIEQANSVKGAVDLFEMEANTDQVEIKYDLEKKDEHLKITGIKEEESDTQNISNAAMYICEPKIDGLAMSLHYENGALVAAATRGDGWIGELVTDNIRQVRNIPKNIADNRKIEVRGEVFMTKQDFENLNKDILAGKKVGKMGKIGEEGMFANPRNVASGTIRQLDSRIVGERNLSFIAYNVYVD